MPDGDSYLRKVGFNQTYSAMTYEHVSLFAQEQWLVFGMGALLLFYVASRYVYPRRDMSSKNESNTA